MRRSRPRIRSFGSANVRTHSSVSLGQCCGSSVHFRARRCSALLFGQVGDGTPRSGPRSEASVRLFTAIEASCCYSLVADSQNFEVPCLPARSLAWSSAPPRSLATTSLAHAACMNPGLGAARSTAPPRQSLVRPLMLRIRHRTKRPTVTSEPPPTGGRRRPGILQAGVGSSYIRFKSTGLVSVCG